MWLGISTLYEYRTRRRIFSSYPGLIVLSQKHRREHMTYDKLLAPSPSTSTNLSNLNGNGHFYLCFSWWLSGFQQDATHASHHHHLYKKAQRNSAWTWRIWKTNICTTSAQRLRRRSSIVQMLYFKTFITTFSMRENFMTSFFYNYNTEAMNCRHNVGEFFTILRFDLDLQIDLES